MGVPRLLELTPAELYLLNAAPRAHLSQVVMLTLKDLSLKDVIDIRIEAVDSRSTSRRARNQATIIKHKNWQNHRFRPHERIFRETLDSQGNGVTLLNFLRKVYRNIPTENRYGKHIRNQNLQGCFRPINWSWYSVAPRLTAKGKRTLTKVSNELHGYLGELKDELKEKPVEAWELMNDLNGLLYLIPEADLEELIYILGNENDKILNSSYSERIYAWFLELEKLKEFDGYFARAVTLVNSRTTSGRKGNIWD